MEPPVLCAAPTPRTTWPDGMPKEVYHGDQRRASPLSRLRLPAHGQQHSALRGFPLTGSTIGDASPTHAAMRHDGLVTMVCRSVLWLPTLRADVLPLVAASGHMRTGYHASVRQVRVSVVQCDGRHGTVLSRPARRCSSTSGLVCTDGRLQLA